MRLLAAIRRHGDLSIALVALLAMELEVWLAADIVRRPAAALVALAATLPLAIRARYPLTAFLVGFGSLMLMTKVSPRFDEAGLTFVLLYVFWLYTLGANTRGRQAWAAAVIVPASVLGFVADDGDPFRPGDIAFGLFIIGGPWLAGLLIRLRRQSERRLGARAAELERERDERARAAVAEERARIARELHDVVAHAISVVIVQARGGRAQLRAGATDESRQAFDAIERTGEQALGEMRRLLGLLRQDDEQLARSPQPSLAQLDALAQQVRAAGLPVELHVDGERVEVPPGVDLSAYRIIQEALTNALKHAGRARAVVRVAYGAQGLEIEVTDDGAGAGSLNGAGGGHGLIGIRERVTLVGGELDAGPLADGGFSVRARLPYEVGP
jgi:signal transduction histidine kinase